MRTIKNIFWWIALFIALCFGMKQAGAQQCTVYWSLTNMIGPGAPLPYQATLEGLPPYAIVNGTYTVSNYTEFDPVNYPSITNGVITTNVWPGNFYRFSLYGPYGLIVVTNKFPLSLTNSGTNLINAAGYDIAYYYGFNYPIVGVAPGSNTTTSTNGTGSTGYVVTVNANPFIIPTNYITNNETIPVTFSNTVTVAGTNFYVTSAGNTATITLQGQGSGGTTQTIQSSPSGLTVGGALFENTSTSPTLLIPNIDITGVIYGTGVITNIALTNIPSANVTNLTINGALTNQGIYYGDLTGGTNMPIEQLRPDTNFNFGHGTGSWFMGDNCGNQQGALTGNVGVGNQIMTNLQAGTVNTAVGTACMRQLTNGSDNVGVGTSAFNSLTNGSYSTAIGESALQQLTNVAGLSSSFTNIALGYKAGFNLRNGSNNIYIGNQGATFDNGQIYIGTSGQQSNAFIAGNVTNNGYSTTLNGYGSYANGVNNGSGATYNTGTQGTTNTSSVVEKFNVTITSGKLAEFNNAGTFCGVTASFTGTLEIALQPNGYFTNTASAVAINWERAW